MSTLRKPEELFKWLTVDLGFSSVEPLKLTQFTRLCRGSLHLMLHLLSLHMIGAAPTSHIRSELHRLQTLSLSNELPDGMRSLLFPSGSSYAAYHRTHAQITRLREKLTKAQKTLDTQLALAQDAERIRYQEKERGVRQNGRLKVLREMKTRWTESWNRLGVLAEMDTAESVTIDLNQTLQRVVDQLIRFVDSSTRSKQRATHYPTLNESVSICSLFEPLNAWISRMNHRRQRAELDDNILEMDYLPDTLFTLQKIHIEIASHVISNRSHIATEPDRGLENVTESSTGPDRSISRLRWEEKLKVKLEDRYNGDKHKIQRKVDSILRRVQHKADMAFEKQIDQSSLESIMENRPASDIKMDNLMKIRKGREERKLYLDALDTQWRKITRDVHSLLQVHGRLVESIFQNTQSIEKTKIVRDEVLNLTSCCIVEIKDELKTQIDRLSRQEDTSLDREQARTENNSKEEVYGKLATLTFQGKISIMEQALRESSTRKRMIETLDQFQEALSAAEGFVNTSTHSQSSSWASQLEKLNDVLLLRAQDLKLAASELSVYRHEMDTLMTGKLGQRGKN